MEGRGAFVQYFRTALSSHRNLNAGGCAMVHSLLFEKDDYEP